MATALAGDNQLNCILTNVVLQKIGEIAFEMMLFDDFFIDLHPKEYNLMRTPPTVIAAFVKEMRRKHHLTQNDLADKSGVGLNFVRNLEQGKPTLRLDKINQVLALFNAECGPVAINNPPEP